MGQEKQAAAKGQESLRKATDTLSTMLAQEVKDLNARQRAARRENSTDPGIMKGLKEATAVLKDLAGVSKPLNDQGVTQKGGNAVWCCCRRWRMYDDRKQECGRRVEASAEADGIYAEAGAGSALRRRGRRR